MELWIPYAIVLIIILNLIEVFLLIAGIGRLWFAADGILDALEARWVHEDEDSRKEAVFGRKTY